MMKNIMYRLLVLVFLLSPVTLSATEPDTPSAQQEPRLYDHYLTLQRMQESMAGRTLEEQTRLQPHLNRAEQKACEQVRRERQEGVPKEDYRRQGGDQFLVFTQQLEQYCRTLH
jgi:hypothetical protein